MHFACFCDRFAQSNIHNSTTKSAHPLRLSCSGSEPNLLDALPTLYRNIEVHKLGPREYLGSKQQGRLEPPSESFIPEYFFQNILCDAAIAQARTQRSAGGVRYDIGPARTTQRHE
jgi:hypothetical protein